MNFISIFDEIDELDVIEKVSDPILKKGIYTQKIHLDTQVSVENPVFDYKEVEITSVIVYPKLLNSNKITPSIFKDIFKKNIYALLEINPDISKKMIQDLLGYFNNKCPQNKIERTELFDMIDSCWETFHDGNWYEGPDKRVRKFHWNPDLNLSNKEKRSIRQTIVNANHFNKEMEKIKTIKESNPGIKQNEIIDKFGLKKTSVSLYWNYKPKDINSLVLELNSR
jgi:hypothetical protein